MGSEIHDGLKNEKRDHGSNGITVTPLALNDEISV